MAIGRGVGKWFVCRGLRGWGKLRWRVNGFLGGGDFVGWGRKMFKGWALAGGGRGRGSGLAAIRFA